MTNRVQTLTCCTLCKRKFELLRDVYLDFSVSCLMDAMARDLR
jgi:hypothetical protein